MHSTFDGMMPFRKLVIEKPEAPETGATTPQDEDSELAPRQRIMYEFFELIAKKMGKWNKGIGADGAHYVENSPFKNEGMICLNCSLFQGGNRCEIVEGDIDPNAICKLWVIREELVKGDK